MFLWVHEVGAKVQTNISWIFCCSGRSCRRSSVCVWSTSKRHSPRRRRRSRTPPFWLSSDCWGVDARPSEHNQLCSVSSGHLFSPDRHRKDELERRMSALQESRRELMVQLEGLMRLLKVNQAELPIEQELWSDRCVYLYCRCDCPLLFLLLHASVCWPGRGAETGCKFFCLSLSPALRLNFPQLSLDHQQGFGLSGFQLCWFRLVSSFSNLNSSTLKDHHLPSVHTYQTLHFIESDRISDPMLKVWREDSSI